MNDKQTERRQEEERERHAQAKVSGDMEIEQGNLGGGREGGTEPSVENVAHNPLKKEP